MRGWIAAAAVLLFVAFSNPLAIAQSRAPKGGIYVNGRFYKGGQFIPSSGAGSYGPAPSIDYDVPAVPAPRRSARRSARTAPRTSYRSSVRSTDSDAIASSAGESRPSIRLIDLAVDGTGVHGQFRNVTDGPIGKVRVDVFMRDGRGTLLKSSIVGSEPDPLPPGEVGSFGVAAKDLPHDARAKLDFKRKDRTIVWVDDSGKDAHK